MNMFDNLRDKGEDMMDDPDAREKIQQIADEHGISMEEAKERFIKQHGES